MKNLKIKIKRKNIIFVLKMIIFIFFMMEQNGVFRMTTLKVLNNPFLQITSTSGEIMRHTDVKRGLTQERRH